MVAKQCVFLDNENTAQVGIHCIKDNGDEFIICLDCGSILIPDEIPYYEDFENWEIVQRAQANLAELGNDLTKVSAMLEKLAHDFGAITISTCTGEFTIGANDGSVYVIPD